MKFGFDWPSGFREDDICIPYIYHICAWWPSWSCHLDHLHNLVFKLPKGGFI